MIPGQKLLYTAFLMLLVNAIICTQSTVVSAADGVVPQHQEMPSEVVAAPESAVLLPAGKPHLSPERTETESLK